MTTLEILLIFVFIELLFILGCLLRINEKITKENPFTMPVNQYGENISDAIQNSHVRGLRGISTDSH